MAIAHDNPNVRSLAERYEAWNDTRGGSAERWLEILADDVRLFSLCDGRPGVEFTRRCGCREEAVGYLAGLTQDWEMEFFRIDEYVAEGDRVVALGRTAWRHRGTGKRCESAKVDVWTFRNGLAVDFAEYYDTAAFLEAASPG